MLKKLAAEGLGTALLLISVVGSGIMGDSLSGGNIAIALLANAVATGCMLYVIIMTFGPISGAHFNPAVTFAFALRGDISPSDAVAYICTQIPCAVLGVWLAHAMFDLPVLQMSTTMHRTGIAQYTSEIIATFGLLLVIFGGLNARPDAVPALVAVYITGAYWFTSSTSFANPAVTLARGFTDTFSGIFPAHIPAFVVAQFVAVTIGHLCFSWLFRKD